MDKHSMPPLRSVRPAFRKVSPLVAKIVLIFGVGNVLLGAALATYQISLQNFAIVLGLTSYQLWGVVFFFLGVAMLWGYFQNEWLFMRKCLFVGVAVKTFWEVALIARYFAGGQDNPILLIIWSVLLAIQMAAYIDFIPAPRKTGDTDERIT